MPTCIIRALEKKEELLLGSVSEVQPTDTPAKTCEPGSATSTVAFKDRSLIDQRMAEWLRKAAEPPGGEVDPGGAAHVGPGGGLPDPSWLCPSGRLHRHHEKKDLHADSDMQGLCKM